MNYSALKARLGDYKAAYEIAYTGYSKTNNHILASKCVGLKLSENNYTDAEIVLRKIIEETKKYNIDKKRNTADLWRIYYLFGIILDQKNESKEAREYLVIALDSCPYKKHPLLAEIKGNIDLIDKR